MHCAVGEGRGCPNRIGTEGKSRIRGLAGRETRRRSGFRSCEPDSAKLSASNFEAKRRSEVGRLRLGFSSHTRKEVDSGNLLRQGDGKVEEVEAEAEERGREKRESRCALL
jgi:hypothetical protein